MPTNLPNPPPQPIRPIDQVQVTNIHQCPLIRPPPRALHTNQPIIRTLQRLHNPMRGIERAPPARRSHRPIRKVPHAMHIRRHGIKLLAHVPPRQLPEGPRPNAKRLKEAIKVRQAVLANLLEAEVRERAAAVRGRDGGEGQDLDVGGVQPRHHVPGIEPAHTMRDNVDALAVGLGRDVLAELEGALFDGARGGHARDDDLHAGGTHGLRDAAPVVHAREELAGEAQLVEA